MQRLIVLAMLGVAACEEGGGNQADNISAKDFNASANAVDDTTRLWVTTSRLERRTCPSERCGVVGQLFFREAANVLERRGEWARITQPYDAACEGGRSTYVDTGNAACIAENGITHGRFAEWVLVRSLSAARPADPAETASQAERLVRQSDDFTQYRPAFVRAANELIYSGRCTPRDFEEQGGWMKSSNHRNEAVYFTYCGEMTVANRIYLNAETGRIF